MNKILKFLLPTFKLQMNFLGELIGGIIQGGASIFGANKSANTAESNNERQLKWERERATNAHQWEIQDLEKAGLNPILSAGGSGAQTSGINPQMPDYSGYGKAGEAIATGIQNAIINKQRQQEINSSTALQSAQKYESETKSLMNLQQIEEMKANIAMKIAQTHLFGKQANSAETQSLLNQQKILESKQLQMEIAQKTSNLASEEEKLDNEIETLKLERENIKSKKEQIDIENKIKEKENKVFYLRESLKSLESIGKTIGMGIGGIIGANTIKSGLNAIKILKKIK